MKKVVKIVNVITTNKIFIRNLFRFTRRKILKSFENEFLRDFSSALSMKEPFPLSKIS